MIPTELILEWIECLINGSISTEMSARQMRSKIKLYSEWDKYLHGLEAHLYSIVKLWNHEIA